jgi:hypothetical protein
MALKRVPVAADNKVPPLLSIVAWFSQPPLLASAAGTVVSQASHPLLGLEAPSTTNWRSTANNILMELYPIITCYFFTQYFS